MCIRIKRLQSQKRLGLLFCLALSAIASTRGGQARPVVTSVANNPALLAVAPQGNGPVVIAMASEQ